MQPHHFSGQTNDMLKAENENLKNEIKELRTALEIQIAVNKANDDLIREKNNIIKSLKSKIKK